MRKHASNIVGAIPAGLVPAVMTPLGALYGGDCMWLLRALPSGCIHTVFADPPFNVGVDYGNGHSDAADEPTYWAWMKAWLDECIRVLAPGGALLVYHLPRWAARISGYLEERGLSYRSVIAHRRSDGLPVPGRPKPMHYNLVYFTKGRPRFFAPPRRPLATCRTCGDTHRDYGGKARELNRRGIEAGDVWDDIPAVHAKRHKHRATNQLHPWLLDRVLAMTTRRGDVVLDPFGGAGTTYAVAQLRGRRWLGCELGPCSYIVRRLADPSSDKELLGVADARAGRLLTADDRRRMSENAIDHDRFPRSRSRRSCRN